MSRHTCRGRGLRLLPPLDHTPQPSWRRSSRFSVVDIRGLTCRRFFLLTARKDRRIRLIGHLMLELGVPVFCGVHILRNAFTSGHAHRATRIPVGAKVFPRDHFFPLSLFHSLFSLFLSFFFRCLFFFYKKYRSPQNAPSVLLTSTRAWVYVHNIVFERETHEATRENTDRLRRDRDVLSYC